VRRTALILPSVKRAATAARVDAPHDHRGRCVVCGAVGATGNAYICADCGDPLGVTLFCEACRRRLALDPPTAAAFLAENGYRFENYRGIVLKVDRCSLCMSENDTVDMAIYRLHFGTPSAVHHRPRP